MNNKISLYKSNFLNIFKNSKMFTMLVLGYSSGFPLMLTASSLFIWYKDNDIDIKSIGMLTLVSLPYSIKWLWSPILDKIAFQKLGRRKGWIFIAQIFIIFLILLMSYFSPNKNPILIAFIAFLICFFSATQDIAINAYQIETLTETEKTLGNSIYVMGYRLAMLVTGSLILIIVQLLNNNWHLSLIFITLFFTPPTIFTLFIKENNIYKKPKTFKNAFTLPFLEFFTRKGISIALITLIIVILYKLSDAIAFSLNSLFFLDLGFSKIDIAVSYKTTSLIFTILGLLCGGFIAKKIGIFKSFIYFSLIMAFANLTYAILAIIGKNYFLMIISTAIEYFCGAMGTAILIAMIMSLVNTSFSATQFAILSSIDSIGRVFVGPLTGTIQQNYGWFYLFIFSFIIGIIVSLLIFTFRKQIKDMANLQ